ncbi:hypothetical protein [Demequina pelophila]|uniref:hypothetical protein n=1 Tax=Demequina pelophila TaxID=1638984 RepID=UPI0007856CA7|nr:hypothetical protein [Demequina pelophila]
MRALAAGSLLACLAACTVAPDPAPDPAPAARALAVPADVTNRLDALDDAIEAWADASSLDEARAGAEAARNLIVGPAGPLYGDADGDGAVAGAVDTGLLAGLDGTPGLATGSALPCVARDVEAGTWDDALAAYESWAPGRNTFPSLPSHARRVVGWATLTLAAGDLEEAREYASHAAIHAGVTRAAFEHCG